MTGRLTAGFRVVQIAGPARGEARVRSGRGKSATAVVDKQLELLGGWGGGWGRSTVSVAIGDRRSEQKKIAFPFITHTQCISCRGSYRCPRCCRFELLDWYFKRAMALGSVRRRQQRRFRYINALHSEKNVFHVTPASVPCHLKQQKVH